MNSGLGLGLHVHQEPWIVSSNSIQLKLGFRVMCFKSEHQRESHLHIEAYRSVEQKISFCSECYSKAVACGAHNTSRVESRTVATSYIAGSTSTGR